MKRGLAVMAICALALTGCDASAGFVGDARHVANQTGPDLGQAGTHVGTAAGDIGTQAGRAVGNAGAHMGNAIKEVGRAGGAAVSGAGRVIGSAVGGAGRAAGALTGVGGRTGGSAGGVVAGTVRRSGAARPLATHGINAAVLHELRFDTANRTVYISVNAGAENAYSGLSGGSSMGGASPASRASNAAHAMSGSSPWHMTIPLGWRVTLVGSRSGQAHIVSYRESGAGGAGHMRQTGQARSFAGMRTGSYAVISGADVLGIIAVVRTQNPYISF